MTYLRDNSYYRRRAGFWGSDGARALFIVLVVIGVYILSWLVLTPASGPLQSFFYPLAKINNLTNDQLSGVSSFFAFRNTLVAEKRQLELDNAKLKLEIERYKILEQENQDLRNLRGAEDTRTALVGKIIAKPPHIPYDILLLDVGLKNSPTLAGGRLVFAEKDIVLGYIASVSTNSSKVLLYSSAGQKLPVVIGSSALPAIASGQGWVIFLYSYLVASRSPSGTRFERPWSGIICLAWLARSTKIQINPIKKS